MGMNNLTYENAYAHPIFPRNKEILSEIQESKRCFRHVIPPQPKYPFAKHDAKIHPRRERSRGAWWRVVMRDDLGYEDMMDERIKRKKVDAIPFKMAAKQCARQNQRNNGTCPSEHSTRAGTRPVIILARARARGHSSTWANRTDHL